MAINKRRLWALVKMIGELPEDVQWDMKSWRCCALGHAARTPWFMSKGLEWDKGWERPCFRGFCGAPAIQGFFGISYAVYCNLFVEWTRWEGTREAVAARITKYVDGLVDHRRART